jgi:hypothetical protein
VIEIIYSKENEKKEDYVRLPKNIRQIGIPDETRKIYIEDYAITYVNQFVSKSTEEPKAAILIGYTIYNNFCEYIFVSGVIEAEDVKINKENIEFSEKAWTSIYDKIKKYFPNQDIVGWFLTSQAFNSESSDHIIKAHIDNFAGNDKLFMKIDPLENEEIFYVFQNGHFVRQMRYYIYYEKNEEMQEYMVQTKEIDQEEPIEQVEDYAAKSFRTIIQEKKDEKHQKKIMTFMYSISTFLVMIVIASGITMMNNYDKMRSMEQTLNSISQVVNNEDKKIASDWFADAKNQDNTDGENAAATTTENQSTDTMQATDNSQQAQEAMNQTAIPVENVAGDVQKQETPETKTPETQTTETQTTETQTPETQTPETQTAQATGTVTEISSSEEEIQNTLESSNQQQTQATDATAKKEAAAPEPQYYTIEKGDTLASISMKIYGNKDMVKKICELNNIDNDNKIQAGQVIQLP